MVPVAPTGTTTPKRNSDSSSSKHRESSRPKSPRLGIEPDTSPRHLTQENQELREQLQESQSRLSASDRLIQRQHDQLEEVTHGAQQTTQQLYGATLRIDELETRYTTNVQALQQQLRDRNEEVATLQNLYKSTRDESTQLLQQAQKVHEQMLTEYAGKIQEAQSSSANVSQVIDEQNQAILQQQQQVQALQNRLQQDQIDYEAKHRQAIAEIQRINDCAAKELNTYKQALAAREADIAQMREAGRQLQTDNQQLKDAITNKDTQIMKNQTELQRILQEKEQETVHTRKTLSKELEDYKREVQEYYERKEQQHKLNMDKAHDRISQLETTAQENLDKAERYQRVNTKLTTTNKDLQASKNHYKREVQYRREYDAAPCIQQQGVLSNGKLSQKSI